ncbi:MAG: recombinase RecA [Dermatophilaceae bacterium]
MAEADRAKSLAAVMAQIEKAHGKGAVMRLGDEARVPIDVIPTGSIALDIALGIGGLPRGRVVEIYGPESSGKTTVALHAVASAQKAGGIAAFIDAEHALDPDYAQKLGVDTDALLVSQPDTGEQALEIADMLIRSGAIDIIVIDSVAALVPRAEIEGEMGDSHVGLQARLMSQALRKLTGTISNTGTTAIFINQLREKIGVMFGCFSYNTRVTLADGSTEKIGKIVNQKLPVEVRTYDVELNQIVNRPVTNWFDNGVADHFLQFTVEKSGGNGRSQFAATDNHQIRTPGGWREAGALIAGDRVLANETARLSDQQWQVVLGGLMGDAHLAPNLHDRHGVRFRMGHGAKQADYLDWKASLFGNIGQSRTVNAKGAVFVDLSPLPELGELRDVVYWGDGKKHLTDDYLKTLSPLALAVWFMDDGSFSERSKGVQVRTTGGSGRVEFCVEAMSEASRVRLADHLRDVHGVDSRVSIRGAAKMAVLTMTTAGSSRFLELVAPYVHPSMDHKLLPRLRGQFAVQPQFVEPTQVLVPARVLEVTVKPATKSMHRFDIEVGGTHNAGTHNAGTHNAGTHNAGTHNAGTHNAGTHNAGTHNAGTHNYFVDGVMVHNSPETTTGGKALKFYASVRLDVRRIETLKDGTDAVGNRTRVKVVKNKLAPPFKQAEFDIIYGQGISREGGLIDMGVEHGFVRKAGAWYTYEGDQLGQGKENARSFLRDNPDLADELEKRIKEKLGVGPRVDQPADPIAAVSIKGAPIKEGPVKDVPIKGAPPKDMPVDF